MARFLLIMLMIYLLYNLIVKFIIPIYRTTRTVKRRMNEMRDQQQQFFNQQQQQREFEERKSNTTPPADKGDYIDYEEVK